jgi:hypothetical protein
LLATAEELKTSKRVLKEKPVMAEKKPEHATGTHGKKSGKKKPHKIITTRAQDGSFGHEHLYEGSDKPVFAGTSQGMEDLHAHMDDHFGGAGGGEQAAEAEPPAAAAAPPLEEA